MRVYDDLVVKEMREKGNAPDDVISYSEWIQEQRDTEKKYEISKKIHGREGKMEFAAIISIIMWTTSVFAFAIDLLFNFLNYKMSIIDTVNYLISEYSTQLIAAAVGMMTVTVISLMSIFANKKKIEEIKKDSNS